MPSESGFASGFVGVRRATSVKGASGVEGCSPCFALSDFDFDGRRGVFRAAGDAAFIADMVATCAGSAGGGSGAGLMAPPNGSSCQSRSLGRTGGEPLAFS